ncbi:cysteine-rich CWC family protein [Paenibacillus sp. YAF4_2]|uniref:cysteine-rich CWC family protein n=1 Tax=Paenibacillus sp. YAF4_2 TaxID=3233085 RepID=UPI003F9DE13C
MAEELTARCPICNGSNQCGNLAGLPAGACWCSKEAFPQAIFENIPPELLGKACVCKACLDRLKATVNE